MSRGIIWGLQQAAAYSVIPEIGSGNRYLLGIIDQAPGRAIVIDNLTDGDMQVSIGQENSFVLAARSGRVFDIAASRLASPKDDGPTQSLNSSFYLQYITEPTMGSVYLSYWYASGD